MEVEAVLAAPSAKVQLVHYHFNRPPASKLRVENKFRVELCLTSRHRSARACFSDVWSTRRFERIGAMFVVPPGMDLLARSDEHDSLTSIVCELSSGPLLELFDRLPDPDDRHLLASLDIRDSKVKHLLLRLADEARHPGFASEMLTESIAAQLSVELFRHGATLTDRPTHGGMAAWQLRLIDERLKEIREAPTLVALAALCRISVRQLTRGFRESRGASIGAYVANSQMEHAKRLLATDETVTTIAAKLGFSSASNFCFAFRRAMGITPGQFRKTLLGRYKLNQ